jgi:hypothetical protein
MSNSEKNDEWENALITLKKTKKEVFLTECLGNNVWEEAKNFDQPKKMPIGESIEIARNKDLIIFMNRGISGFTLKSAEQLELPEWKQLMETC